jgi:hypothetical protein
LGFRFITPNPGSAIRGYGLWAGHRSVAVLIVLQDEEFHYSKFFFPLRGSEIHRHRLFYQMKRVNHKPEYLFTF